jgi:hypothetical protein
MQPAAATPPGVISSQIGWDAIDRQTKMEIQKE